MGKKSKSKKAKSKITKKEESKGFLSKILPGKKTDKKSKGKKSKKAPKIKIDKTRLIGIITALASLMILVSVVVFLFNKAFRPTPIAKLLPADRTIFSIEVNTNLEHSQVVNGFKLINKYPQYSEANLLGILEDALSTDFEDELQPWVGRQVGMAILQPTDHESYLETIYFIEFTNQKLAEAYFQNSPKDPGTHLTFLDNYVILSNNKETLSNFIASQEDIEPLYKAPEYRRIDNNLPLSKLAYIYVDFQNLDDNIFKNISFFSENGISKQSISPFLDLFNAQGFALISNEDKFTLQSFISLNTDGLKEKEYITFQEKYQAELTKYIPQNTITFWGGKNLEHQINKVFEVLAKGEDLKIQYLQRLLENQSKYYFGPTVSFKKDVLPLFTDEFALTIENTDDLNIYKLLVKLKDPQEQPKKLAEIANKFATLGSVYEPQIIQHTLEDGTVYSEKIAIPQDIQITSTKYKNHEIQQLVMGDRPWGIYYTILDDVAIFASHIDGIISSIDLEKNPQNSLQASSMYVQSIQPLLQHSDEITYLNLEDLVPMFMGENTPTEFLNIIGSFTSGRNYFQDGIVTINYLGIK